MGEERVMEERRSRKEQKRDRERHYAELASRKDEVARRAFLRPAYMGIFNNPERTDDNA